MRRCVAGALVAAVCALVWSAAPAYPQGRKKVKLVMPVVALSMTPVYLAQARGYFDAERLDVAMTTTNGGGPDVKAVIDGGVDFAFTPGDNVLLAVQAGKRVVIVMTGLRRLIINWAMRKDVALAKGITETTPLQQKIKALKSLTVGVTRAGALTAHLASLVIRKAGYVPQQDVKVVPIGTGPEWLAALGSRKVDVALTATPVPETAVAQGFAIMFINNAKGEDPSLSEFLMGTLVTRRDLIAKDPDLVRRMVRALTKANKWALGSSPDQVARVLKPFLSQTSPTILADGVKSTLQALSPEGRTTALGVRITQAVLEQASLLRQRMTFVEVATNDFLPE